MSWTWFTDRNLGRKFAEILRGQGLSVERQLPLIGKIYLASAVDLVKNPNKAGRVGLWYP